MIPRSLPRALGAMALTFAAALAGTAQAQTFPSRPVDIVVPYVPGGTTDLSARILAKTLNKAWNVPVRVVNKPGGNTVPAVEDVLRAKPDGYTVLLEGPGSSSLLEVVARNLPFQITDRTFLTAFTQAPTTFFVSADSPYRNLNDVVADLKADPTAFTWTSSIGPSEVIFWQLFDSAGVDRTQTRAVKLRGGAENATAAATGQVKLGAGAPASAAAAIAAGKLRLLAVAGDQRSPSIPEVPTTAEQGYPDIRMVQWHGVSAPPALPPEIATVWIDALNAAAKDPEVVAELGKISMLPFQLEGQNGLRDYVLAQRTQVHELLGLNAKPATP